MVSIGRLQFKINYQSHKYNVSFKPCIPVSVNCGLVAIVYDAVEVRGSSILFLFNS